MRRNSKAAGIAGLAFVALVACSMPSLAQSAHPADQKSSGQFTGLALITDDAKWFELFNRPEAPVIRGKDRFTAGQRGALAIIFSNAKPKNGKVRIECDVTAFDPKGSSAVVNDGVCYEGPYRGDNILHPALLDLHFAIGPDDPAGRAGFKITLRDVNSGRRVKLAVDFAQGGGR